MVNIMADEVEEIGNINQDDNSNNSHGNNTEANEPVSCSVYKFITFCLLLIFYFTCHVSGR